MTTRSRKKTSKAVEAPATDTAASPDEVLAMPGSTEPDPESPAEPTAAEPEPEAVEPPAEPVKETPPERAGGSVTVVYRGPADVISHGAFRIRPGQPVTVPSDVAEELLTFPHERFEKVESQE